MFVNLCSKERRSQVHDGLSGRRVYLEEIAAAKWLKGEEWERGKRRGGITIDDWRLVFLHQLHAR